MPHNPDPKYYICTNPKCPEGVPTWKDTGKPSSTVCYHCGQLRASAAANHAAHITLANW